MTATGAYEFFKKKIKISKKKKLKHEPSLKETGDFIVSDDGH
jgi:hypothetical protein